MLQLVRLSPLRIRLRGSNVSADGGATADGGASACGPTYQTVERTIMVPQQVTETRTVTRTVYRQEQRERTYTVHRQVPRQETRTRTVTYYENENRTREESYTTYQMVNEDRTQEYQVCVPHNRAADRHPHRLRRRVGRSDSGVHGHGSARRAADRHQTVYDTVNEQREQT